MTQDNSSKIPWHYISHNKASGAPANLIFVDTETIPTTSPNNPDVQHHTLRLATAIGLRLEAGKETRVQARDFFSADEWWSWVYGRLNKRRPTWIFAHNLGFDWTILGGWLEIDAERQRLADDLWPLRKLVKKEKGKGKPWRGMLITDDPPTIISTRHGDSTIIAIDTLNYFRCPLAELGTMVGWPKLPMPSFDADDSVWLKYCYRDTRILKEAMCGLLKWWKEMDLGNFRYTAPGLAWNAYRHRFMKTKILVHRDKDTLALERESYYGGETRCFYCGVIADVSDVLKHHSQSPERYERARTWGPIEVYDVRSLYPAVMSANKFPCKLIERGYGKPNDYPLPEFDKFGFIAHVYIDSPHITFPVRKEGKVEWAVGKYWTTLAWPELRFAWEHLCIANWGEWCRYQLADLFSDYVSFFFTARAAFEASGNNIYSEFCKLLLNSLYGKFGQREGKWITDLTQPCLKQWGRWYHGNTETQKPQLWRAVGFLTQKLTERGESAQSCPAIPAFVTSYGRQLMRELREVAGEWNVLYQDTDSLHVFPEGGKRLSEACRIADRKLGKLRFIDRFTSAEYFGLKHYRCGDNLVIAGRSMHATAISDTKYEQSEFQRLDSCIESDNRASVRVETVRKTLSLCHPGGNLLPSGRVEPVRLEE